MKMRFYHRILILPVLVVLWNTLVPHVASGQDYFVISKTKLTNSEPGSAGDEFGYAVAIDGSTLMGGAPWDDDGASNSGAAYWFNYTDGSILPQPKLTENGDAAMSDYFGNSLDISGDALVIGAYKDDIDARDSGSAFVFRSVYDEETETWSINGPIRLETDEPGEAANEFGYAVAISGDVAVVGAHREDDVGSASGSVYVFRFDGSAWHEEAKLLAGDARRGDKFGSAVAIAGNTIVVGAIQGGKESSTSGSVYVFEYEDFAWEQKTELFGVDIEDGDQFGYSVAIEGDTIIAGAPRHDEEGKIYSGAAYVFRRSGGIWNEKATKLTNPDLSADDRFGNSVALSGNIAVVGAYKDDVYDVNSDLLADVGSVYVFRFDGSVWNKEVQLIPSSDDLPNDSVEGDEFGYAVAISGDLVLVGAHKDDVYDVNHDLMVDAGSVYVFTLTSKNQPPVAIVGEDQEVVEGDLVVLDGSLSEDQDGDSLTYEWVQKQVDDEPMVDLDLSNPIYPTFIAPQLNPECKTLTFELTVTDDKGLSSEPATVKVKVLPSNTVYSELRTKHHHWASWHKYEFKGSLGEEVTITLDADPNGWHRGNRATLILKDKIRGVWFRETDRSGLPNTISAKLPADGEYAVYVFKQPWFWFWRHDSFEGDYILTLEGTCGKLGTSSRCNKK
jgi:hypothetical protein